MSKNGIRVSVLLSTRNRCYKLQQFLEAIKGNASVGSTPTEVIVIDNNSSDRTKEVVERFVTLGNPLVRYLFEGQPGKSHALNGAISEAKGDIIALTDDDCIPDPSWIGNIVQEFDSDSELSVLGGRVELYDDKDVSQAVVLLKQKTLITDGWIICARPAIIGANMAFRRKALEAIRGFDPLLGPGTKCKAAEDIDVVYRSLKKNFKIVYSPEVVVLHNHGRQTRADENHTSFAYGLGRGAFYAKNVSRLDLHVARIALRELYDLTKTLVKGLITRTRFPFHEVTLPAIFLGAFYYSRERLSWHRPTDQPVGWRTDADPASHA